MTAGIVYFMGAGPGDPDLLPVKSVRILQQCDVILYDRLAPVQILKFAGPDTQFIYCGKEPGCHAVSQREINQMLVRHALFGRKVVRLKGGDPAIFGRLSEEMEACREAGVPFELIPGITAAVGVAAYAGIPLTRRNASANVAFISGSHAVEKCRDDINWSALAKLDTIVVYMGMSQLDELCRQFIRHGQQPDTPVAIIRWGTTSEQQTCVGTLKNIAAQACEMKIHSPALIIIGEVVGQRQGMSWFEQKPLFGKKVLLLEDTAHQLMELSSELSRLGAETVELSLHNRDTNLLQNDHIIYYDCNLFHEYMKYLQRGGHLTSIWISSVNSLKGLHKLLQQNDEWADQLRRLPEIICVGEQTAIEARRLGWPVSFVLKHMELPELAAQWTLPPELNEAISSLV